MVYGLNLYLGKICLIIKYGIMNMNEIGYWNKKKEKLKEKYTTITDEDLSFNEGKEQVMLEMLGYKLGKTKEELVRIIVSL